jgi:molecular chaperone DnaK (HSP70)
VQLLPEVLHVGERPPRIAVRIANASCATLTVEQTQLPPWLRLQQQKIPAIPPGEVRTFLAEVVKPLQEVMSGAIEVITPAGKAEGQLLVIDRKPKLECEPNVVSVWIAPNGKRSRNHVKVRPIDGLLRILSVRIRPVRYGAKAEIERCGQIVGEDRDLNVEISLTEEYGQGKSSVSQTATLEVEYQSPHGAAVAEAELKIDLRHPPQLRWTGEYSAPEVRWQSSGQQLRFEFRNQSAEGEEGGLRNGTLVLEDVELSAGTLRGVPIKRLTPLPLEVEGGAAEFVEFELDLSSLQGNHAVLANLGLKVTTNLPVQEWKVPLKVEPMAMFEGVVAIDFGSSNSCCAVWSLGTKPELLALDEKSALVSPTVVRYLTLETTPPGIETGQRVKRLAAEYADIAASTADQLKQRLGDARQQISIRPETEARWVERDASEVASDYLRNIRHVAEMAKGAFFHDFILTHPARCSLRQYTRLRDALEQAFGAEGNRVQFLQEPIAALMGFLVERAKLPGREDYTVASFDLGGGTTDIALVKVQYEKNSNGQLHIRPQILYCNGEQFGGEDLTDFLCKELAVSCQSHISAHSNSASSTLIVEGIVGAAELDIRRNRAELRRVAEQFKASLSQEEATELNRKPSHIEVRVLEEGQARTKRIPFASIQKMSNGSDDLTTKFTKYARREISQRAKLLQDAVKASGERLNIIQISGKTTYLPVAREAVAAQFSGVDIVRAPHPKECVVTGACQSRSLRRGSVVVELDKDTQRMTSTIGAFSLDSPYFQPILQVNQVIPMQGLVGRLARAWDGADSVVLWEDLDGTGRQIADVDAAKSLDRLGTWMPTSHRDLPGGQWWTLQVRLQEFHLKVEAIGPDGDSVAFCSMQGDGE